jgi:transposase
VPVLFIGDDWAEAHHDIEIQDEAGRRLVRRRLPEGMAGIAQLHELIGQHVGLDDGELDDPGQVVVGIETDRGPWVQALLAAGYQVFAINPLSVARYRERHTTSGVKSDPGDAKVLADLVRTDRQHHRPIAGDSELARGGEGPGSGASGAGLDAWAAGEPAAFDAAGVLSRRAGRVRRADAR